jgi:hypothetical protein
MKSYTISKKKSKKKNRKTELINFKCIFEGQDDIFLARKMVVTANSANLVDLIVSFL